MKTPCTALAESYAHCRAVARRSRSSFYLSFCLLPRPQRQAMCALYAMLRHTDDLGDGAAALGERRGALEAWREQLEQALEGAPTGPLLPAVVDVVRRYRIPPHCLTAVVDGVKMDLDHAGYETFDELARYCYHVASTVGLMCIHVWGFSSPAALPLAERCGVAFQLTNILRDLREDALRGRVYLPREDFRRFGLQPGAITEVPRPGALEALIQFEVARARALYQEAAPLEGYLSPAGQRAFRAMRDTYRELLETIACRGAGVLDRRVVLGRWRKLAIVAGSLFTRPRRPVRP